MDKWLDDKDTAEEKKLREDIYANHYLNPRI